MILDRSYCPCTPFPLLQQKCVFPRCWNSNLWTGLLAGLALKPTVLLPEEPNKDVHCGHYLWRNKSVFNNYSLQNNIRQCSKWEVLGGKITKGWDWEIVLYCMWTLAGSSSHCLWPFFFFSVFFCHGLNTFFFSLQLQVYSVSSCFEVKVFLEAPSFIADLWLLWIESPTMVLSVLCFGPSLCPPVVLGEQIAHEFYLLIRLSVKHPVSLEQLLLLTLVCSTDFFVQRLLSLHMVV